MDTINTLYDASEQRGRTLTIDMLDALIDSPITFVPTRHEQGAAFIADVYGRLTGRAGVCLSTLGPGATNLVTGVADANMDRAPLVAISGQGSTARMHKESHQILDLVNLFDPITKFSTQIREPEIIPEIVRKAFKTAQTEKPGASFIDFPENVAGNSAGDLTPLKVQYPAPAVAPAGKCKQVADLISIAKRPIIMAGNGVIREQASKTLVRFAESLNVPVATTFMAKGAIPSSHELSLGAIGLQARDYVAFGFAAADLIICVGVDMVEYHPRLWNPDCDKRIVHIDATPAEVDAHYILEAGVVGNIADSLDRIASNVTTRPTHGCEDLRDSIRSELEEFRDDTSFPVKPQKIIWDLREALAADDIVISDVGAHKMWIARMYQAEAPKTCIISNGFAAMGIALPGAIAAKLIELYKENRLINGTLEISGQQIDLSDVTMPVLNVYAEQDHIIPPPCSTALEAHVGTKDYSEIALPGGHVGVYVSSKSQGIVADGIYNWLGARK